MQTTLVHSGLPRTDQRRAGGTLSGQITGNQLRDVTLLATLLDMLAEDFFGDLIAGLAETGLEEVFPIDGGEGRAGLTFMLHPYGQPIILELEVVSWVYQLPQHEFHDHLFKVMKPTFLRIYREFTFNGATSDPEGWFRMMKHGATLLNRNRS